MRSGMLFRFIVLALVFSISACHTVTVIPEGGDKLVSEPKHNSMEMFYPWGLIGESVIDVQQVCGGEPAQMQTQMSIVDGLVSLVTIGLVMPRNAKIWCQGESDDN